MRSVPVSATVVSILLSGAAVAQAQIAVDFENDVLPMFRQHCIGCHGPDQQMGGYRLDRKSVALREDFGPITPTNASASRLYLRLIGNEFGNSMPPAGRLSDQEISIIRNWIDQGAEWPDHLANERDLPPPNPEAVAMMESLRRGDREAFMAKAVESPDLLNARGSAGSTPFMYAVLYGDAAMLQRLLELGADPNIGNDGNATPLIWAATDFEKTRVLVEAGADVNARSDDMRTPLFAAAATHGAGDVIRLLVAEGADVNPPNRGAGDSTPLLEAARVGDAEAMRLLIDAGAETQIVGGRALGAALTFGCEECVEAIRPGLPPIAFTEALFMTVPFADAATVQMLLDNGASLTLTDSFGRTALMHALASDVPSLEVVQLLVEAGSDVNLVSQRDAEKPLSIARLRVNAPIIEYLVAAGATADWSRVPELQRVRNNSIEAAVGRSIPLLQRADVSFSQKTGCISCHNNSLPAMAVSHARSRGFAIDESMASRQVEENVKVLSGIREKFRQGISFADIADASIFSYVLVGLDGEGYAPDANTDTVAMYVQQHQMPDGSWPMGLTSARPPLTNGTIGQTALALRGLQLYAPNVDEDGYEDSIERAAQWLAGAEPLNTGDLSWKLLGLGWAGRDQDAIDRTVADLIEAQHADGGWSDIDTLPSGAFATGQALVALKTAGVPASHPAYERGVGFLLETQLEDGSWYVKSRALGFQPYFDNGFPHGLNQWISGAATSWATMALALASESGGAED